MPIGFDNVNGSLVANDQLLDFLNFKVQFDLFFFSLIIFCAIVIIIEQLKR